MANGVKTYKRPSTIFFSGTLSTSSPSPLSDPHRKEDPMYEALWRSVVTVLVLAVPVGAQVVPSDSPTSSADAFALAVFAESAPEIDGVLDEPLWASAPVISDFRQREPVDGGAPSEDTEVRIAYDANNLYFGFVFHDSEPELIRRSILQREGRIDQDDHIWIALDTYNDDRNAYIFELNSFGTQGDALFSDESMTLADWNWEGVYRSEARITSEGWTLEVAIPFTTIRFTDATAPEMGIAFRRAIRRKNEEVMCPHIPQDFRGGITNVSQYATLRGLRDLRKGRHMELKPFAIVGAQKFGGSEDTDVLDDIGVDFKYALTSSVTLDLTYNTDFAQVESDNVQINLTRFSLFFPEKREFFLERAGLFQFGKARDTEMFFSRRIGLGNDIIGGGRVTGQAGPLSIGVLTLNTDDLTNGTDVTKGANNSVIRLRADVLPRTTVGGIFTSIQNSEGHNRVVGADAQVRFMNSSSADGWFANVWDSDNGTSSAAALNVNLQPRQSYSVSGGVQTVDADFNPGLGFVRRRDMVKYNATLAFTPRFEGSAWARSLVSAPVFDWVNGQDGSKQSTSQLWHNMLSLQNGGVLSFNARRRFERLDQAASIQGRPLTSGDYEFSSVDLSGRTSQSNTLSGRVNASFGNFWNGTRTTYGGSLTWKTGPNLTVTGSARRNNVDLPVQDGAFSTTLMSMNVLAAVSRDLFANALVQWDDVSETLQANIRINWIHTPGSDLFLVFDSGYLTQDLLDPRESRWLRRTGVVKLTYMLAF